MKENVNQLSRRSIMHKEILEQPAALEHTIALNAKVAVSIADLFKEKDLRSVIMVGRGSSDNACVYFKYLFEKLVGWPCSFSCPSVSTIYGGKPHYEGSLVIGVSQSGMGVDVNEIIKDAKLQGALTVGVTNDPQSTLAHFCEKTLLLDCGEEKSVAATKTFLCELACLALLVEAISGDPELRTALSSVPHLVSEVIANEKQIEETALTYKGLEDCYFLARGYSYAACLESALKLQETTYARGKAYSMADFYHGPFAVVSPEQDIVLLHSEGKMDEDAAEMMRRLLHAGCQPLLITNDHHFLSYAKKIDIPTCDELVGCFPLVASVQLFVNALAEIKGRNPDAPRGLKKITITK